MFLFQSSTAEKQKPKLTIQTLNLNVDSDRLTSDMIKNIKFVVVDKQANTENVKRSAPQIDAQSHVINSHQIETKNTKQHLTQTEIKPFDYSNISDNANADTIMSKSEKTVETIDKIISGVANGNEITITITDKNTGKTESKSFAATDTEGMKKFLGDDLFRVFRQWVVDTYVQRQKHETDKLLRPSSPKVISPPNIIPTTSKTILAENKEAVDAGKEFSELNKKKRA